MPLLGGGEPADFTKYKDLRSASHVRIHRGVRPYGGKRLRLIRYDEDTDTVVVAAPDGVRTRLVDNRTYRFDEVEAA